jgi:hypothetical protein
VKEVINMLSYSFKISETKSVNLRLTSKSTVALEDKLGMSPLEALMEVQRVPKTSLIISILHGSLQALEHGYTEDKTYELYDEFVENGGTMMEILPALVEVFKVSGFFKEVPKPVEVAERIAAPKKALAKK